MVDENQIDPVSLEFSRVLSRVASRCLDILPAPVSKEQFNAQAKALYELVEQVEKPSLAKLFNPAYRLPRERFPSVVAALCRRGFDELVTATAMASTALDPLAHHPSSTLAVLQHRKSKTQIEARADYERYEDCRRFVLRAFLDSAGMSYRDLRLNGEEMSVMAPYNSRRFDGLPAARVAKLRIGQA